MPLCRVGRYPRGSGARTVVARPPSGSTRGAPRAGEWDSAMAPRQRPRVPVGRPRRSLRAPTRFSRRALKVPLALPVGPGEVPLGIPLGACRLPVGPPTGSLQAPSGTSHSRLQRPAGRPRRQSWGAQPRATRPTAGRPPVRPRCPPRAQARGRVGPGTPAHPRDAPLTHPLVLAGMSANEAPSQVRKRKGVTDAELSADQKHFLTQFVKAFVRKRPGPSRTASTAAAQGGAGLRAMDLLVRPCPRPPARRSRRPPHPNPSMPRIRRQTSWSTRWTPESSRISSPSRPHPRRSLAEVPLVRRLHC